ncbi:MAG: hypothetical protein K0R19_3021 [Bacillota bacterium]|jgi:hypothetical protein|nr:hypothetical protein [Bacillota bacterium]
MKILAEPIEAAVWFKAKEKPWPVKFRYSDREGMLRRVNVDKIISVDEIKTAGIRAFVYRCQSEIDGVMKAYELKYLVSDCRWELYKM